MPDGPETQRAHDALLWWCSERGGGTWEQFREACDTLELQPRYAAWALSTLAHVEFDWHARRFATAPAVLTTVPGLPGRLLACGARPSGFLEPLRELADSQGLEVIVDDEPAHQYGHGPAVVLIHADPSDAAAFASEADVVFSPEAAARLASVLPPLSLDDVGEPGVPDARFPHCLVDPLTLIERWDEQHPDGMDGLWAWPTYGHPGARYLHANGHWHYLPQPEFGPYLLSRPEDADPACRYEPAHQVLVVHGRAPLPPLAARAACLCSGLLPLRQHLTPTTWEDHYVNVPPEIAQTLLVHLNRGGDQ